MSGETVGGIILGSLGVLSGICAVMAAKEKGPILSNDYIFSTAKERADFNRKAEYKLLRVVFGCLSIGFLWMALYTVMQWRWAAWLGGFFMAGAAVYTLATGIGKLIRRP